MRARGVAVCISALLMACDVSSGEKPEQPSTELLEFLGTYETAGRGGMDPMGLAGAPESEKGTAKADSRGSKGGREINKGKGKRL